MVTPKEVREAIANLLRPKFPEALILPRQVVAIGDGELPTILKSPNDSGRVNGWVISRVRRESTSPGSGVLETTWRFAVNHYYQFEIGNNASNSEDRVDEIYETAAQALADSPHLELDEMFVLGHSELNFDFEIKAFGNTVLHVGYGVLEVSIDQNIEV